MFNWLQHKTGLFNIRCDLRELRKVFPHVPLLASRRLLLLIENVTMEVGTPKFIDDVRSVIHEETRDASPELRTLANTVLEIALAVKRKDNAALAHFGPLADAQFKAATGVDIDPSQMSWFAKLATRMS